jgi:hypothetical protein
VAIENLNQGDWSASASIPFNDPSAGADRRGSVTDLATLLQALLTTPGTFQTQYFAPNANAWAVTVSPLTEGGSVWLLVTPTGTFATATITLPALATADSGQEVLVSCTQIVTTLTVSGNGATVNGAPTTLAANGFFRLKFDGVLNAWYRVG